MHEGLKLEITDIVYWMVQPNKRDFSTPEYGQYQPVFIAHEEAVSSSRQQIADIYTVNVPVYYVNMRMCRCSWWSKRQANDPLIWADLLTLTFNL